MRRSADASASPAPSVVYFAYGSNMDPAQMARRCPGAVALGAARLPDYRLTFTYDSVLWGGGVGHVEEVTGDEVWGVLWGLTDSHVEVLDEYESVRQGVYRKARVRVEHAGREVPAMIYLSTSKGWRRPSSRYLEALLRGATAHRLPREYIERLREFGSATRRR